MSAYFAKLTTKAQTTVPKAVREALGIKPGDTMVYRVSEAGVALARAETSDQAYLKSLESMLSEWEALRTPQRSTPFDGNGL